MSKRVPIFNVPSVVVVAVATVFGVHILRLILPEGFEEWLFLAMAFIPARYAGYAGELPGGETAGVTSFVTHMLVHGDAVHLMFNAAWLLAFGGAIALRLTALRFLFFATACGIAGAAVFLAVNPGLFAPVVGASGAISGLMGGTMRFLFTAVDRGGIHLLREAPRAVPVMPLPDALRDRRILAVTAVWMVVNILAMLGLGTPGASGGVAWEAHVGGYVFGLLTYGLFDRRRADEIVRQPIVH